MISRYFAALLTMVAFSTSMATAADKPLKVYILAGQSNMQGYANVYTFDSMADDPKTAPLLKEMRDKDGKPKVCEKVWISSVGCLGDERSEQTGKLTAGFGAGGKKNIGPEFTFGLTMEKALNEPILIIKTSWGGRSLHTDFRSPSAGPFVWGDYQLAKMKERGDDIEKEKAKKEKATGVAYRDMIAHTQKVLKDIKRVVPDYDEKQGYELAGFVWFQGFNDLVGFWEYPNRGKPGGFDMYAELLGHFIRDVRKDLNAPKLPFVVGVMGIDGLKGEKGEMKHFRDAQRKAAALDEFKGNVFAVETAPFWDDELQEKKSQRDRINAKLDSEFAKNPKLTNEEKQEARKKALDAAFKPGELKRIEAAISNAEYHYLGAAKIMAPIGKAFAEALLPQMKH
jgi:alpha-galactosidase